MFCIKSNVEIMKLLKLIFLITLFWKSAYATPKTSSSYVLNADHIEYGKTSDVIIAKGNVEIFKDSYTLKADKIIYDKSNKTAYAYNNVVLTTPNGEKTHAESMQLNNDFKEGMVENLTAYLQDNNIIIAKKAEYKPSNTIFFEDATYTPCQLCKGKNPQWQIKARKARYTSKETMSFRHSIFEVYGVPIFYTPYFKTFAPNAPPQSGVLIPKKYKYKKIYGNSLAIPIYYRIADNQDLLYSPMVTTKQGILHQAKYRHLRHDGYYELQGNYINPKINDPNVTNHRYHITGKGTKQLNDNFSLNAKLNRVSDKSYLHNYWDINENYLTSDASLIYDKTRDYGYVSSFYFQDLRNDPNNLKNPVILPTALYHKELFYNTNKFSVDTSLANILRKGAQLNTKRLSADADWEKTHNVGNNRLTFIQRLKTSIFKFSHIGLLQDKDRQEQRKEVVRVTPESEIKWSYPMLALKESYSLYIQPLINPIISPNSSKNNEVINEDSKGLELNDSNLFSSDRYEGYDQIEHGNRVNYGFNGELSTKNHNFNFLFGQVFRERKNKDYSLNSGLYNKNFSDYVGHIAMKPFSWLNTYYRFRFDGQNARSRKQELDNQIYMPLENKIINSITIGNQISKLNYIKSHTTPLDDLDKVISLNANIKFLNEWFIEGSTAKNYTKNKNFMVKTTISLGYTGQCSTFKLTAIKDYTHDSQRNIKPNTGFTFDWDIHLKNIN